MPQRTTSNPGPLACLACRSKHLKCDAKQPTCGRCALNKSECIYARSRRGYVGGRRKQRDLNTGAATRGPTHDSQTQSSSSSVAFSTPQPVSVGGLTPGYDGMIDIDAHVARDMADEPLIDVFYRYIYPAHPFIIPRQFYKQQPDTIPRNLKRAIHFITKPLAPSYDRYNDTFADIFSASLPSDCFQVQALLLLTIGSYARGERANGDRAIEQAVTTSYSIGLDSNAFGSSQSPLLQESWRRTWWELYSIAGMMRVLTPTIPKLVTSYNKLMPGPEAAYASGQKANFRSLGQMQGRHFAEDNFRYSSFAWRIEAVRILNDVVDFAGEYSQQPQSQRLYNAHRASIRSFLLTISMERQLAMQSDGEMDELLFCALTTIHLASLLLNLPRSSLRGARSFDTVCATNKPNVFGQDDTTATITAVEAADTIVQLLVDRPSGSMRSVSPCFSCVLAFATTTHLSAFYLGQDADRMRCLREYLQVSLNALDVIGRAWPIATVVRSQLAEFSREALAGPLTWSDAVTSQTQPQGQLADVTGYEDLSLQLVPGAQDDSWLQDLIDYDTNFALA